MLRTKCIFSRQKVWILETSWELGRSWSFRSLCDWMMTSTAWDPSLQCCLFRSLSRQAAQSEMWGLSGALQSWEFVIFRCGGEAYPRKMIFLARLSFLDENTEIVFLCASVKSFLDLRQLSTIVVQCESHYEGTGVLKALLRSTFWVKKLIWIFFFKKQSSECYIRHIFNTKRQVRCHCPDLATVDLRLRFCAPNYVVVESIWESG